MAHLATVTTIFIFCAYAMVIWATKRNMDAHEKTRRVQREVEYLQQDYKKYKNMSLVLLEKCTKIAAPKRVPCMMAVLDNDQLLLMKMMKRDPLALINMVNGHLQKYPDVPLRKYDPDDPNKKNKKCSRPPIIVN